MVNSVSFGQLLNGIESFLLKNINIQNQLDSLAHHGLSVPHEVAGHYGQSVKVR